MNKYSEKPALSPVEIFFFAVGTMMMAGYRTLAVRFPAQSVLLIHAMFFIILLFFYFKIKEAVALNRLGLTMMLYAIFLFNILDVWRWDIPAQKPAHYQQHIFNDPVPLLFLGTAAGCFISGLGILHAMKWARVAGFYVASCAALVSMLIFGLPLLFFVSHLLEGFLHPKGSLQTYSLMFIGGACFVVIGCPALLIRHCLALPKVIDQFKS